MILEPSPDHLLPAISMTRVDPETFLPLTAPEYHVLLALGEQALHGYAMMQALDEKTGGRDALLPGTLYATLARMVSRGMIAELDEPPEPGADRRRRYYRVTALGRDVARAESARLLRLLRVAEGENLAPEAT
jgi:DNA-binding PadR family transcriptional regulator